METRRRLFYGVAAVLFYAKEPYFFVIRFITFFFGRSLTNKTYNVTIFINGEALLRGGSFMIAKNDIICFLGDSITQSDGTTDKFYWEYIAEMTGATVYSFGVNGAQSCGLSEQLKRIVARKSDKVGFCTSNELIHRLLRKLAYVTKRLTVVALNVGKVKYDKIPIRLLFNGTGKFS